MAMENYSPSHPTDEVDNSPDTNPVLTQIKNKSHSKSPEIQNSGNVRSRSGSLSKRRRSKSKSKNKQSPSSNTTDKSFNKDHNSRYVNERSQSIGRQSRSIDRRSYSKDKRSRSKDRRSRSKDRRSRSKDRRSHSKDRRSRSKDRSSRSKDMRSRSKGRCRRSRSRDHKSRGSDIRPKSREERSRSRDSNRYSKSRDSPGLHRNKDRINDNIFSKMTELSSTKPSDQSMKMKWTYDSDDDIPTSSKQETMNVFESLNRYDDMKPLPRRSDFVKDPTFSENRIEDMKPLPRRSDFNNRRGGDQFRGFNRNKPWEPRNARSNYSSGKFIRNNSGNNDKEDYKSWQNSKYDEGNLTKMNNHSDLSRKMDWNEGKHEIDDESDSWGKGGDKMNSPGVADIGSNVESDTKGFAADSDEEFGAWGKEKTNSLSEMLTIANLESQGKKFESKANYSSWQASNQSRQNTQPRESSQDKFADNSDEEYGAWGSEQKSSKISTEEPSGNRSDNWSQNKPHKTDNFANDSDEEFGSWGKDRKPVTHGNNDKSDPQDSSSQSSFYSQNSRNNFNRNDANPRFQGRRGSNNNNYNRFQRPNNQERFNNNSNNFSNNNNFNNNYASNNNNNNASNNSFSQQPSQKPPQQPQSDMMPKLGMQMPPYNFNPTQRPPQWPPINNMNFPPICNGQLPFSNMSLLPQMQFSPLNQQPAINIPTLMQSMQSMSYIPPPPPSTQPTGSCNSSSQPNNFNSSLTKPGSDSNNLLETIMTNVGLSSKSIRLQPDMFKPQSSQPNKSSVSDSLSNIIKSAASSVLSRLVENSQKSNNAAGNISDNMSMSPPSPSNSPPPPKSNFHSIMAENSEFVLPPLPNYSDILKPSVNNMMNVITGAHSSSLQSAEICEEKRNRSDFESKGDWQERIALEVKNFLRPAYMSKKINKCDYKEIMKRCVTKISRSGVTEINTEKIEKFVLSYVDKYQKFRRVKQHGVVSSSEHELVM